MSTTDAHGPDAAATATETHDEPHDGAGGAGHGASGHDDHHADEEPLGPIDVTAWGLGILGVIMGGVVAVLLAMSVGAL